MTARPAKPESRDYGADLQPGERSPGPYAANATLSRGRRFSEPDCPTRSPFQRDRDRIVQEGTPWARPGGRVPVRTMDPEGYRPDEALAVLTRLAEQLGLGS